MAALRDLRRVFFANGPSAGRWPADFAAASMPWPPRPMRLRSWPSAATARWARWAISARQPGQRRLVKSPRRPPADQICSLAFSPDGKWLASMDTAGETRLWNRGDWSSRYSTSRIRKLTAERAAAVIAKQVKSVRWFVGDSNHIVSPVFVSRPRRDPHALATRRY